MYIIVIAWLYVAVLMAATEPTFVRGALTFLLYGLAPLAVFVWLFGRRRRSPAVRERADQPDARHPGPDQ